MHVASFACVVIDVDNRHFNTRGIDDEVDWRAFFTFVTGVIYRLYGKAVIAFGQRLFRGECPVTVFVRDNAANFFTVITDDHYSAWLSFTVKGWRGVISGIATVNWALDRADIISQGVVAAIFWRGSVNDDRIHAGLRTDVARRIGSSSGQLMFTFRQVHFRCKAPAAVFISCGGAQQHITVINGNDIAWLRRAMHGWASVIGDTIFRDVALNITHIVQHTNNRRRAWHTTGNQREIKAVRRFADVTCRVRCFCRERVSAIAERFVWSQFPVACVVCTRGANQHAIVIKINNAASFSLAFYGRERVIGHIARLQFTLLFTLIVDNRNNARLIRCLGIDNNGVII